MSKEIKVGDYVKHKKGTKLHLVTEVGALGVHIANWWKDHPSRPELILYKDLEEYFEVVEASVPSVKKDVKEAFSDLRLKLSDLAHRFPHVKEYKELLVEYNKAIAKLDQ